MAKITPSPGMVTSPYEWDEKPQTNQKKTNEAYISAVEYLIEYIIGMDTLRINV